MMDFHPASNLFPLMSGEDFEALISDIAEHGQQEAIWLHPDGSILDGRNRWRACEALGIAPLTRIWDGEPGQEEAFVVSLNLYRRHLDREQRAVVMRQLRAGGMTYQAIADAAGVSFGTAYGTTKDVELINFDKLPGADGKHYPPAYAPRREPEEQPESLPALPPVSMPHVSHNSGNNEWYTPQEFTDAAREVMGDIDLDPASSELANTTVGAGRYFAIADDGLAQDWAGRVWLNPPYASDLVGRFIDKLIASPDVTEAIVLVNNATETKWFQALATSAQAVCFPSSRVRFWNATGTVSAPLQGQAILYLGNSPVTFMRAFSRFGWTVLA